mmetsp:Transcript_3941/g.12189  ORF Transcript_3941/g.12189 Transcript_3941/m.12189 type:complete len:200 (+) Transcript_3941:360-959(+)
MKVRALVEPPEGVGRLGDELRQIGVPRHRTVAQVKVAPVEDQPGALIHPHHAVEDDDVSRASAHRQQTKRVQLCPEQPTRASNLPRELDGHFSRACLPPPLGLEDLAKRAAVWLLVQVQIERVSREEIPGGARDGTLHRVESSIDARPVRRAHGIVRAARRAHRIVPSLPSTRHAPNVKRTPCVVPPTSLALHTHVRYI